MAHTQTFDRLNLVQDNEAGPTFEPVFVTDYKILAQDLAFTNQTIPINTFFDPNDGIHVDNRVCSKADYSKQYMEKLERDEKIAQKEKEQIDRKFVFEKNQNKKSKTSKPIQNKSKKDENIPKGPYNAVESQWDDRIYNNPKGGIFDPKLRKDEIFGAKNGNKKNNKNLPNINYLTENIANVKTCKNTDFLVYNDIEVLEKVLTDKQIKLDSKLNENDQKVEILNQNKDYEELDFVPVKQSNKTPNKSKNIDQNQRTQNKNQVKNLQNKGFFLSPSDGAPNRLNQVNPPYEKEIPWAEQLEHFIDATKNKLPEFSKNPNIDPDFFIRESQPSATKNPYMKDQNSNKKVKFYDDMHQQNYRNQPKFNNYIGKNDYNQYEESKRDKLQNKFSGIKQELDPLLKRWMVEDAKFGFKKTDVNPTAEAVENSAGRLIKVYNDKLTEMLIDDLQLEMVQIQNKKEEQIENEQRKKELTTLYATMINQMGDFDDIYKDNSKYQTRKFKPNSTLKIQNNTSKLVDADQNYGLTGPFKVGNQLELPQKVNFTIPVETIVEIAKEKGSQEKFFESLPHFNKNYRSALTAISDKILLETYHEVYSEVNVMVNSFVKDVVKDEIN